MYTYINGVDDHPLDMRFVAEKDPQNRLWMVFDTRDANALVGVHKSETLAVLDAFKRAGLAHCWRAESLSGRPIGTWQRAGRQFRPPGLFWRDFSGAPSHTAVAG